METPSEATADEYCWAVMTASHIIAQAEFVGSRLKDRETGEDWSAEDAILLVWQQLTEELLRLGVSGGDLEETLNSEAEKFLEDAGLT